MPYYTYHCHTCGGQAEIYRKIDERDLPLPTDYDNIIHTDDCPYPLVARALDAPGFVLKGGGWFKDGYQKKETK